MADLRTKPIVKLNPEFSEIVKRIEESPDCFFITGRAGTGKSTLLRLFSNTTRKNHVVLAPTGIAALNVKGQTIHSFFRFPPNFIPKSKIHKVRNSRIYRNLDTIIIDEISMVRADMLDNIDYFLRLNRNSPLPFGGVQMIFFGDLFQIAPVISSDFERRYLYDNYESPYFFSSHVLNREECDLHFRELHRVYRQQDPAFINLLESIRLNQMDWDLLEELNSRYQPEEVQEGIYITLSPRNIQVKRINEAKLQKLEGRLFTYKAGVLGEFPPTSYPTDYNLSLKAGAQVMFIRNDPDKRFVNGTLGTVVELDYDLIKVEIENTAGEKEIVEVNPEKWEHIRYYTNATNPNDIETEVAGTFEQYPLKLAWAITIHKSQGKTFKNVILDMGKKGAFTHGQTYVALSRCTSLEGLILKSPIKPADIMVDPVIVDYYENMRRF